MFEIDNIYLSDKDRNEVFKRNKPNAKIHILDRSETFVVANLTVNSKQNPAWLNKKLIVKNKFDYEQVEIAGFTFSSNKI